MATSAAPPETTPTAAGTRRDNAARDRPLPPACKNGLRPFVDAHHHLQQVTADRYPWLRPDAPPSPLEGDLAPLRRDYLIGDFLGDATRQNLAKSVHIQNGWEARHAVNETAWLHGIADRHGFPHGIIAYADLASPGAEATLDAHAAYANVRGVRQILSWSEFRSSGVSHAVSGSLRSLPHLADTQVVLDHAGMPADRSPSGLAFWFEGMKRLAQLPNLAVKISGLRLAHSQAGQEAMRSLVLRTIEAFGVEGCMFGSNFRVDGLWAAYDTVVGEFRAFTSDLSAEEQHALFCVNAGRIDRL